MNHPRPSPAGSRASDAASAAPFVHLAFAAAAGRHPEAVAVVAGERSIAYANLLGAARALTRRLTTAGVGPGHVVGIFLPAGPELVAVLVAVLAAGGAYVVLDPLSSSRTLAEAVGRTGPTLRVTNRALRERLVELPYAPASPVLLVDEADDAAMGPEPSRRTPTPADPACFVHAAGAAGPLLITHGELARRVAKAAPGAAAEATVAGLAEGPGIGLWHALSRGATVVLAARPVPAPRGSGRGG